MSVEQRSRPDVFRARPLGYELRDSGGAMPLLHGQLAVFNEWTEIASRSEGNFMERLAPGAFSKTIQENQSRMRCLFQHGKDPVFADKPLGPIVSLQENRDNGSVEYEVPLLDTSYNRDLVPMLQADPPVLGSSFRFAVVRQDLNRRPSKSAYNPRALPERTVQEVRMSEFGPVTFPAYPSAGAGLRSLTDRMLGLDEIQRSSEVVLPEGWWERADIASLYILMDMYQDGKLFQYMESLPEDSDDRAKMQQVLDIIGELMQAEASEPDPYPVEDPPAAGENAATPDEEEGDRTSNGSAGNSHPANGRRESLFTGKRQEVEAWRLR